MEIPRGQAAWGKVPALQPNSWQDVASPIYGLSGLHVNLGWWAHSPQGVKSEVREGDSCHTFLTPHVSAFRHAGLFGFCRSAQGGTLGIFLTRVAGMFGASWDEGLWNWLPLRKGPKAERRVSVITPAGTPVSSQPTIPKAQSSASFAKNNHKGAGGLGTFLVLFCVIRNYCWKGNVCITWKQLLWTAVFMEMDFCYAKPLLLITWIEMRF